MTADLPQSRFDDLYTAVYALIDDAKTHHQVVKLYKGSHASPDPHPVVLDYGEFFAACRRGVLGYACHSTRPGADDYCVANLEEFDRCAGLCGVGDEEHEAFEELRREASTSGGWSFTHRLPQSSGHACVEVADRLTVTALSETAKTDPGQCRDSQCLSGPYSPQGTAPSAHRRTLPA